MSKSAAFFALKNENFWQFYYMKKSEIFDII